MSDLTDAMTAAAEFINTHGLDANSIKVEHPRQEHDHTTDQWIEGPPTVNIGGSDPAGFLAWCETVHPEHVSVERSTNRTDLRFRTIHNGMRWTGYTTVDRPASGPHLPQIPTPWARERGRLTNRGHVTVAELRTALTALGVLGQPAHADTLPCAGPLPEKLRKARDIDEGYEVQLFCVTCKRPRWVPVRHALHVLLPMPISLFTLDDRDPCHLGAATNEITTHPGYDLMSRRPAVKAGVGA